MSGGRRRKNPEYKRRYGLSRVSGRPRENASSRSARGAAGKEGQSRPHAPLERAKAGNNRRGCSKPLSLQADGHVGKGVRGGCGKHRYWRTDHAQKRRQKQPGRDSACRPRRLRKNSFRAGVGKCERADQTVSYVQGIRAHGGLRQHDFQLSRKEAGYRVSRQLNACFRKEGAAALRRKPLPESGGLYRHVPRIQFHRQCQTGKRKAAVLQQSQRLQRSDRAVEGV